MKKCGSKKTKTQDIEKFLTKTGFILEMEVAEILRKRGYNIEVNRRFYDYDENKYREIDIIATKKINEVVLILVIECKQSLVDDWVFICSDKKPDRFFQYLKHTPEAKDIKKTKIFDNLPMFNSAIPLAQNYTIKDIKNKKSTSPHINMCLEKLPKALVDIVDSRKNYYERKIYLPIAVFGGQIFIAKYNKKLQVKNSDWIQYESSLESDNYTYHPPYNGFLLDTNKIKEGKINTQIAKSSQDIGYKYLIDFITKTGLSKLIIKIESEISKLELIKWTVPKKDH